MSKQFLDRSDCFETLKDFRFHELVDSAEPLCATRFQPEHHGNLSGWHQAWKQLPEIVSDFDASGDCVRVLSNTAGSNASVDVDCLRQTLMKFHPWRKGPFELFGVHIDTEWRSCWKWDRFASHLDFSRKRILDVGCGNGYYGWRMLQAGASLVVGCEPFLLSIAQFEVFRRYWPYAERHFILPLADSDLPRNISRFDITCSMGVLYHRANPIDHLQILASTLRSGGQLLLETIVLIDDGRDALVPEDRYAKMRNVWFLPSIPMLERWLRRTGFKNIQLLNVARTTVTEQRRTDWMTFESLSDFLDPNDSSKTIEGYPAPVRAVLLAEKI